MAPGATPSRSCLCATYYDTADRALNRRGMSLRVREADGRFVQSVKADGTADAGVPMRGEWEDEIAGGKPDLEAPLSGGRLPPGIADHLKPLFATAVTRTTIALEPSPSLLIEAAIEEGEIRGIASAAAEEIAEVELELKRGEPAALLDAALQLLRAAPLHIEVRSKAERGYAAIAGSGEAAPAVHAPPIVLGRAMPAEAALKSIGRACVLHLLRNERAVLAGEPEGVHQMRVASRRIRAALRAMRKVLSGAERQQVKAELDRLDEVLAPARNLDVFAGDLLSPARAALCEPPSAKAGEAGLGHLALAVETARQAAHEGVRELLASPRYTEAVLRLLRSFEAVGAPREGLPRGQPGRRGAPGPSEPIGTLAPRLFDRCLKSVRRRGKGYRQASAGERHKLRIAVKELRYAGELLASLFDPELVRSFGKPLRTLQADLGYENDVRVGRELLGEIAAQAADREAIAAEGASMLGWHEERVRERERKVAKHLRRLNRAEPFWRSAPSAEAPSPDPPTDAAPPALQ